MYWVDVNLYCTELPTSVLYIAEHTDKHIYLYIIIICTYLHYICTCNDIRLLIRYLNFKAKKSGKPTQLN